MNRNLILTTIVGVLFITIVSGVIIFLARGYTFNPKSGQIQKTGIMVITSEPNGAAVYLNEELKDTTNTTINFLAPGSYNIRVTKDGFTPWMKKVAVKPELVTRLDLVLFPQVPDLRRLTFVGVSTVTATPDGNHAVYNVTDPTNKGLWVMSLSDSLPLVNNDPIQIYKDTGQIDLSKALYTFSPDGKMLLLTDTSKPTPVFYLLNLDRVNDNLVSQPETSILPTLLNWYDTYYSREKNARDRLVNSVKDIPVYEHQNPDLTPVLSSIDSLLGQTSLSASPSPPPPPNKQPPTRVVIKPTVVPSPSGKSQPTAVGVIDKIKLLNQTARWSPKQDRILFQENGQNKLYDLQTGAFYSLPKADAIEWLPTDQHLILINPNGKKGEIALSDLDGQNQVVIFSGQFVDSIAIPWTSGTRIVVLTNLNQATSSDPNLYAVNLR